MVASLIVIAIIAILAVVIFKGSGVFGATGQEKARPDGRGGTLPGLVTAQAEDSVCRSNLSQLRMAINMQRTTSDTPPATIEETKLGPNFLKCPMGDEKYQYDAATGEVFCPHLGHEKF
jgi:hypothetical protein